MLLLFYQAAASSARRGDRGSPWTASVAASAHASPPLPSRSLKRFPRACTAASTGRRRFPVLSCKCTRSLLVPKNTASRTVFLRGGHKLPETVVCWLINCFAPVTSAPAYTPQFSGLKIHTPCKSSAVRPVAEVSAALSENHFRPIFRPLAWLVSCGPDITVILICYLHQDHRPCHGGGRDLPRGCISRRRRLDNQSAAACHGGAIISVFADARQPRFPNFCAGKPAPTFPLLVRRYRFPYTNKARNGVVVIHVSSAESLLHGSGPNTSARL